MPNDSLPVRQTFERFFAAESTPARVRAAEPVGFDPALWRKLVEIDAPFMRVADRMGGGGMSLFDACLMMEQAGGKLAAAPLAEVVVALRVLGELGGDTARRWIDKVRDGKTLIVIALHQVTPGQSQLVPGGAVAHGILTFDGKEVAIEVPREPLSAPATLGGAALGLFALGQFYLGFEGRALAGIARARNGRPLVDVVYANSALEAEKIYLERALASAARSATRGGSEIIGLFPEAGR